MQCHSLAVGHRQQCHETISQNVQCYSLAVRDRKRGDESTIHKMCHVTHSLLVIRKDVMRVPFTSVQCHLLALVIEKHVMKAMRLP